MSDFTTPATNQTSSSTGFTFPNKKNKNHKKTIASLIIFVLLIIGGVSAFVLFNQNQDTRNQASVKNGLINAKLAIPDGEVCTSGQICTVDVIVNTGNSNIDALQLKIAFDQNIVSEVGEVKFAGQRENIIEKEKASCMDKPGFVLADRKLRFCSTDADCPENQYCNTKAITQSGGSGIVASPITGLSLNKNEVSNQGALLVWTLSNTSTPFTTNGRDQILGKLHFRINGSSTTINQINLTIDQTLSKATLYRTGEDSLNTPSSLTIKVGSGLVGQLTYCKSDEMCPENQYCYFEPTPSGINNFKINAYCKDKQTNADNVACKADIDCKTGQYCYQPPMPTCPEGKVCPQIMPEKYCKLKTSVSTTPTPTSTPTPTPTSTPTPTPTKRPSPTVAMSVTPAPVACPVPDCRNGVLKQSPNLYGACPVYLCIEQSSCKYTYSNWSSCNYGVQTRTVTSMNSSTNPKLCANNAPVLQQECTKPCTSDKQCGAGEFCELTIDTRTNPNSIVANGSCRLNPQTNTDINSDGITNVLDLSIVIKNLFTNSAKADINKDGIVDVSDYSLVLKGIISREAYRTDVKTVN